MKYSKVESFSKELVLRYVNKFNANVVTSYRSLYMRNNDDYILDDIEFINFLNNEICSIINTEDNNGDNSIYNILFEKSTEGEEKSGGYIISGDGRSSDIFKHLNLSKIMAEQYLPTIITSNDNNTIGNTFLLPITLNGMSVDFTFDKSKKVAQFNTNRIEVYRSNSKDFEDIEEEYQILKTGYYANYIRESRAQCINVSANITKDIYRFHKSKLNICEPYLTYLPSTVKISKGSNMIDEYDIVYDKDGMIHAISGIRSNKLNLSRSQFIDLVDRYPITVTLSPVIFDPFNVWFNLSGDLSLWAISILFKDDDTLLYIRNTIYLKDESEIVHMITSINDDE